MSDSNRNPNAERSAETVDWAARLRASMNAEDVDAPPEAPVSEEGDDLRALLLAQLAQQREAPDIDTPDTSEFEADIEDEEEFVDEELIDEDFLDEEDEELLDEEDEELLDEEDEELLDEEDEELLDEEDEELLDEEDEELLDEEDEELLDEDDEELLDEDDEELLDEDDEELLDEEDEELLDEDDEELLDEEDEELLDEDDEELLDEDDEELLDEDDEELLDEEDEELLDEDLLDEDEDLLDEEDDELLDEDFLDEDEDFSDESEEYIPIPATVTPAPQPSGRTTDARLNGRMPEEANAPDGANRRRTLSEENARLLAEMETRRDENESAPARAARSGYTPRTETVEESDFEELSDDAFAESFVEPFDESFEETLGEPLEATPSASRGEPSVSTVGERKNAPSIREATRTEGVPPVVRPRPAPTAHDPLQIGYEPRKKRPNHAARIRVASSILDEELPVETPEASAARRETYADAMPSVAPAAARERDANLWADLGYHAELTHAEDRRAVERGRVETASAEAASPDSDHHVTPTADAEESSARHTTEADRAHFKRIRTGRLVRSILAVVGAVALLGLDYLPVLSSSPAGGSELPFYATTAYPILCLALMVLFAAPFATRLGRGLVGLFRFAPTRYSPAVLSLVVGLAYNGMALAVMVYRSTILPLFGGLPLCALALTALSEWLDARGEAYAFDLVTAGRPMYVLTDEITPAVAHAGSRRHGSPTPLSVVPTSRVVKTFERMGRYNSHMAKLNFLMPAALGFALLSAGIYLFFVQDAQLLDLACVFAMIYLAVLPASYVVALSLPIFQANRQLADSGSAIIGASAPDAYARDGEEAGQLFLCDGDILTAIRCKEIALRDSRDPNAPGTDHWRRLANRIFFLIRSPLAMEIPFEEDGSPETLAYIHMEILEQEENCLKLALMDNTPGREETVEVLIGSHDALTARGIRLPQKVKEQDYRRSENSHVVYLAFDGKFRIGYAAEYRVRADFATLRDALRISRCRPVLVTYDPMLTPAMLAEPRFAALGKMEVVRPTVVDVPRRACSSGVVTLDDGPALAHPLAACRKMKIAYRRAYLSAWLGMTATTALLLAAVIFKSVSWVSTLAIAGLQVLITALIGLIPLLLIRRKTLHLSPRETQKFDRTLKKANPDKRD